MDESNYNENEHIDMFNEIGNRDYVPVCCLRDDKLFTLSS